MKQKIQIGQRWTSKKRLVPFLFPASLLVHGDIMKPLGDVQRNFSYIMKISINNENLKYFSTTQKVQKGLPARSMELWYYWVGSFA